MFKKTNNLCRVCVMESEESVSMYDVHNDIKYCDLIKDFTGLDMTLQSNFPSTICGLCSSELMVVVNFVTKCRNSDVKLHNILEKDSFQQSFEITIKEENVNTSMYDNSMKQEVTDYPDDDFIDEEAIDNKPLNILPIKRKLQRNDLTCKICGIKKKSKSVLIMHSRVHTGERPFACAECGKRFTLKCVLNYHIKRKHSIVFGPDTKTCVCEICGKSCPRQSNLRIHMRTHTKEKPYKCKLCFKTFTQSGSLLTHTRIHTGERPYACKVCGKGFTAKSQMNRHVGRHTTERNFKCPLCEKSSKSRGDLKVHILTHKSEKNFVCDICSRPFTLKHSLKEHIKNHHSERAGTCRICRRDFPDIEVHNRKHTGEKPFLCSECPRKFRMQKGLDKHMKMHLFADKYACSYEGCTAAYAIQERLDVHISKEHKGCFPYACKLCSKGYYRLSALKAHKSRGRCRGVPRDVDSQNY